MAGFFKKVGAKIASTFTGMDRIRQALRPEIVEPYLNGIDSHFLYSDVMSKFRKDKNKEGAEGEAKFKKIMKQHFVNDIFGSMYNPSEKMKLGKRKQSNEFRYRLLERVNRSGIKIVSNNSTFASTVYTQEVANYFYQLYKDLPPEQMKKLEEYMSGEGDGDVDENTEGDEMDGSGDGGQQGKGDAKGSRASSGFGEGDSDDPVLENLTKMLNSKKSDEMLEVAMKAVEEKLEMLEKAGIEVNESNAREMVEKIDLLDKHRAEIAQLAISKEGIYKAVKKIMEKSTAYFSHRYKVKEVDLYEAEDLLAVEGLEHLHPLFRKGMIDQIVSKEKIFYGKYDLYVDNSGSMGSSAHLEGHPNVSCMLLAKAIALKMKRMDLLNNLYEFQSTVTKLENTEVAVFDMAARGGTDITNVLKKVKETGNNSVVLTDGEDAVGEYLDNVVFLGVNGVNFSYFKQSPAGKKFLENNQCIIFDGKSLSYAKV